MSHHEQLGTNKISEFAKRCLNAKSILRKEEELGNKTEKNVAWAKYIAYINDPDVRYHRFGLRDLGRGLSAMFDGYAPAGVAPVYTAKMAAKAAEATGVWPLNPLAIKRHNLSQELDLPCRTEPEDLLLRGGPARVVTQKRTSAMSEDSAQKRALERADAAIRST